MHLKQYVESWISGAIIITNKLQIVRKTLLFNNQLIFMLVIWQSFKCHLLAFYYIIYYMPRLQHNNTSIEFVFHEESKTKYVKPDYKLLRYRTEKAFVTDIIQSLDPIGQLELAIPNKQSIMYKLSDVDLIKLLNAKLLTVLRTQIQRLHNFTKGLSTDPAVYIDLTRTMNVLKALMSNQEYKLDQKNFNEEYLKILVYSENHKLIAQTLSAFGSYSFQPQITLIYHYVRNLIEHANSFHNCRIPLSKILILPGQFTFEFTQEQQIISIQVDVNHYNTNFYLTTKTVLEENGLSHLDENSFVFHALLNKIRMFKCSDKDDKIQMVRCVLLSYKIFSLIELVWQRSDDSRSKILNIFTFPPDYHNIFKQFLQLFLMKQCSTETHIHILEIIEQILSLEQKIMEADMLMSFAQNFTLLQKIISDLNNYLRGKKSIYVREQTLANKTFLETCLKLFNLNNVEAMQVFNFSYEIVQAILYSKEESTSIVALAGTIIITACQDEVKEHKLIEFLIDRITEGNSPHLPVYISMINSLFSQETKRNYMQRRDSTNLAKKLVESKMFETLSFKLQNPIKPETMTMELIELISSICSETPLLTQKLNQTQIISKLLQILSDPQAYPINLGCLITLSSFFHHICLKDGPVRQEVLSSKVLESFMRIYEYNQYCQTLSTSQKQILNLYGSINRFLSNIPICSNSIFLGISSALGIITIEMNKYEQQFDSFLDGKQMVQTISYEHVTMKINNILKLYQKLSLSMVADNNQYAQLFKHVEQVYHFKYLNLHNALENKWISSTARFKDLTNQVREQRNQKQKNIFTCVGGLILKLQSKWMENVGFDLATTPYFQLVAKAPHSKMHHDYLEILIMINRLDRYINVAKNNFRTELAQSTEILETFSLVGVLDQYRYLEQSDFLNKRFQDMETPRDMREIKQFLKSPLKQIAQRNHYPLLLQQTIKRLIAEMIKVKKFDIHQKLSAVLAQQLQQMSIIEGQNTLGTIYRIKLKLQNLQLLLDCSPQVTIKNKDFPIDYNSFVFYLTQNADLLFKALSHIISQISKEVKEENQKVRIFTEALRNQLLNRIIIILNNVIVFNFSGDQVEVVQEQNQQRQYVNFVIEKVQKSLMKFLKSFPVSEESIDISARISVKNMIHTIVEKLLQFLKIKDFPLFKAEIHFKCYNYQRLSFEQLKIKLEQNVEQFVDKATKDMHSYCLYQFPILNFIKTFYFSISTQYKKNSKLNNFYRNLVEQTFLISQKLFENYSINLGVKHLKKLKIQYQSVEVKKELEYFNVILSAFIRLIKWLKQNQCFSKGELEINSNIVVELIRLASEIISNAVDIKEKEGETNVLDSIIKRIICLIIQFRMYESEIKAYRDRIKKQNKKKERRLFRKQAFKKLQGGRKNHPFEFQNQKKQKMRKVSQNDKPEKELKRQKSQKQLQNLPANSGQKKATKNQTTQKEPKISILAGATQEFLQRLFLKGKMISIISLETLQEILIFITKHFKTESSSPVSKKQKLFQLNIEPFFGNLLEIKIRESNKQGLIAIISKIGIRIFTIAHRKVDIEACLKRIFYEKQRQSPTTTKFPNQKFQIVTALEHLSHIFKRDQLYNVVNTLFVFKTKEQEVFQLKVDATDQELKDATIQLKQNVDLAVINTMPVIPKNRRKSSQKQVLNIQEQEEYTKFIDYCPEGQLYIYLKHVIERMIENILDLIKQSKNKIQTKDYDAFNFDILSKTLHILVRESPALIPFIARYKCKKVISACLSKYDNQTKKIILDIITKNNKEQNLECQQVTFISLLIRLFNTVSFDRVNDLIFEICLDNYILHKTSKGVLLPLGSYIRSKVIDELGLFTVGSGCLKTLSYLDLLTNLLNIKEFARQCLQEPILNYMHKQVIQLCQQEKMDYYVKFLSYIVYPLTIIHNINVNLNVSKQKPLVITGILGPDSIKNQLIPNTYLRRTSFLENWPYILEEESEEVRREVTRYSDLRQDEDSSQDDTDTIMDSYQGDEQDEANEEQEHFMMEQDIRLSHSDSQMDVEMSDQHEEGWTDEDQSDHQQQEQEGFPVHQEEQDFDQQLDQIIENQDVHDDFSQLSSLSILQQMYRSDNREQEQQEYPDLQDSVYDSIKEVLSVDKEANNSEYLRLLNDMQKSVRLLLVGEFPQNSVNQLYIRLKSEDLFLICQKIYKDIEKYQNSLYEKLNKNIYNLEILFPPTKTIYDDTNIFHQSYGRRRHGEIFVNRNQLNYGGAFRFPDDRIQHQAQHNIILDVNPLEINNGTIEIAINPELQQQQQQEQQQHSSVPQEQANQQNLQQEIIERLEQEQQEHIQAEQSQNSEAINPNALNRQMDVLDNRINELLTANGIDIQQFNRFPHELQDQILSNILLQDNLEQHIHRQGAMNQVQHEQNKQQEIIQEAPEYNRRRKLSIEYYKKMQKDPKQILLKEKRQSKIYQCENQFIISILNLLYLDENHHSILPYSLIKALCANPVNQTKFLSTLMIILVHHDLQNQKQIFQEDPKKFPKTIIHQKNNEVSTDYKSMGFNLVSLKILHLLSHLSKKNPTAMFQQTHNKVQFLPQWYWIQQKPYYLYLINLVECEVFKSANHLTYLIEILYNITHHYYMKYIHDSPTEFMMKLEKHDVRLLCSILQTDTVTPKSVQIISKIIVQLCLNQQNLNTFVTILYHILDELSNKLIRSIKNETEEQACAQGKLHNILLIISQMFQTQYKLKLEKQSTQKETVKNQVIRSFKSLIECKSLQQLCRNCVEYLSLNNQNISPFQMNKLSQILQCFFIIYKIILTQEQDKQKKRNISALGNLNTEQHIIRNDQYKELQELYHFICTREKTILNTLLKQKLSFLKKFHKKKQAVSIFDEPMIYVLTKNSSVIDFENKRSMFKAEIKNLKTNKHYHQINLTISRQNILQQSMYQIMNRTKDDLKGKLHIEFEGQQGEDAGGLTREWFMLLSKEIFNPNYAIFKPSSVGNTYQPSPYSQVNDTHHLKMFQFVGRIVGKAMHDGHMLDTFFTPAFYKHILGRPLTYHDIQEQDYELYKNMKWISQNVITDVLDITFSYQYDNFGQIVTKDLIPNGSKIPVTESNKLEYVQLLCYAKMAKAIQKQIQAFLQGFHELIPPKLVSIFDPKELELMISGLPTIDIQDLKENTDLVNYDKNDNIIQWLFQILEGFDVSLRASFLQFVTGTSRVPSEGFKGLRGMNGPQKFNIHKDFDATKLPRAHTCFNQLDLPMYPTKEILIEKLTMAITEGKQGFGMI